MSLPSQVQALPIPPRAAVMSASLDRGDLPVLSKQSHPGVEMLRQLQAQLLYRFFRRSPAKQTLAVCSADHGDGRSWLVANLAVLLAQSGLKTLIIDADGFSARQHSVFGLDPEGLADWLAAPDALKLSRFIQTVTWKTDVSLDVLAAGRHQAGFAEILASRVFEGLLTSLSARYDAILVDTPPATQSVDYLHAARQCGAALLVAHNHHNRLADVANIRAQLTLAGVEIIGAVLNNHATSRAVRAETESLRSEAG